MGDYLSLLEKHPGTRITTVRLLGKKTSEDNVLLVKEHIETEDEQGNARQVEVLDARTCDFGHLFDQQTHAAGICQICNRLGCSQEDCMRTCSICGDAACKQDRTDHNSDHGQIVTICIRHKWRRFSCWLESF